MTMPLVIEGERLVRRGDQQIVLTGTMWRLLTALIDAPSRTLPIDALVDAIGYDSDDPRDRNCVRVFLFKLRCRIERNRCEPEYVFMYGSLPRMCRLQHVIYAEPPRTTRDPIAELIAAAHEAEPHVVRVSAQRRLRAALRDVEVV